VNKGLTIRIGLYSIDFLDAIGASCSNAYYKVNQSILSKKQSNSKV